MTRNTLSCTAASLVLFAALAASAQSGPTITSISPDDIYVTNPATTITLSGTGFASGDLLCLYTYYGCYYFSTAYVSSTELTFTLPANFLSAGEYDLSIVPPTGYDSNLVVLYVSNLAPTISSFSPVSVMQGSTPAPITVNGNFMTGATVQWNGTTLATTTLNPTQLQFTPSKGDIATASMVSITVTNPSPGGASLPFDFDVTYKATVNTVALPANDIVYDPYAQLIYAALPSSYGSNGNSIAVIKPATGKITGYYYAGSEPHQLALSSDSQYLYVGLNGSGSVQRLILPNFTPDIDISLGTSEYGGPNVAYSLQVSPASDHTWAVSTGTTTCCSNNAVYFYTDAAQLPDSITSYNPNQIVFLTSSTLYAYYSNTLTQVTVSSSGGTTGTQWSGLVEGSSIAYANGLIYGNDGQAFNPATGLLLGTYDFGTGECCDYTYPTILPDAPFNRLLALGTTPFFSSLGVTAYSLDEFTPQAVADLSQFAGDGAANFIFWGSDGAAFVTQVQNSPSEIVLVTSSELVSPSSSTKNPKPSPTSLSPSSVTHGAWNTLVTINGTDFAPGATVTWNGASLYTAFVSSTQLNLYVPYTDLATAGSANVVVKNPTPGGGKAAPLTFTID